MQYCFYSFKPLSRRLSMPIACSGWYLNIVQPNSVYFTYLLMALLLTKQFASILSQTTHIRCFQTGRVADDNFRFDENARKSSKLERKHCGKRRNCSLRAISPFFHSVFNTLLL